MPRYPSQGSYYSGGDRIGDLLNQRAQMAGQVQDDPWARNLPAIIGQLGQGVQGFLQNREEQKAREEQEALKRRQSEVFNVALQSNDPKQILFALGPDAGSKVLTALKANTPDGFKAYRDKMEAFRDTAIGIENAPEADRPKLWGFAIQNMASMGALTPEQAEQYGTYDPAISKSVAGFGAKPGEAKVPEAFTLGEGQVRYGPGGEVLARGPEKPKEVKEQKTPWGAPFTGPDGLSYQRNEQSGEIRKTPGVGAKPSEAEKPPTPDERKTAGFFKRASEAEKILGTLEKDKKGRPITGESFLPTGEDRKKYLQAQDDFTMAFLRRESMAQIGEKEKADVASTYFPVARDPESVIKQKAAARKRILDNLSAEAGGALGGGTDAEPPDA